MTSFPCYGTPPPNITGDAEQYSSKGGITVKLDFEQLNGDSVRSESLSVR